MTFHHNRTATCLALALLVGGLALQGCKSDSYAPHQPVPGVDTGPFDVYNPHDAPEDGGSSDAGGSVETYQQPTASSAPAPTSPAPQASGPAPVAVNTSPTVSQVQAPVRQQRVARRGTILDQFVTDLAQAYDRQPGTIAVFPALTKNRDSNGMYVNGLGEYLMQMTSDELTALGIRDVKASIHLLGEVKAVGGLGSLEGGPEATRTLARRIGATYVVYGTADQVVYNRLNRDEALRIDWQAAHVSTGEVISNYRKELPNNTASRELYRQYQLSSRWTSR